MLSGSLRSSKMKKKQVRVKCTSEDREAVKQFLRDMYESYFAVISRPIESSDGGWHGFATMEMET